ncbi:hypothetical protein FDUTEX481_06127 [Tolypothrix sp. PCC 7601]|nr:hypothetical protein FDUTEX481_06127 [Tolypothrix sp. PCC 7601]
MIYLNWIFIFINKSADVGWVEERNPTSENFGIVGFHSVQPNLHLFLSSPSDIR